MNELIILIGLTLKKLLQTLLKHCKHRIAMTSDPVIPRELSLHTQ